MRELRIVLVDDSPIIRDYLETTLTRTEGCTVIGTAADGLEAVKVIRELRPQVVVLDITMPHRNGIEVLRDIRKEDSNMVIIMFTADPSVVLQDFCLKEGANYYLNKSEVLDLVGICKELVRGGRIGCSGGHSSHETF